MAQREGRKSRRVARLARRFGMGGTKGVTVACMALIMALGALGLWRLNASTGVTVVRDGEAEQTSSAVREDDGDAKVDKGEEESAQAETRLIVHVDGAVASPGVYVLEGEDVRVNDLVEQAGGLAEDADTSGLNLAAPLSDGEKVHVPHEGEALSAAPIAPTSGESSGAEVAGLVNINTASAEELIQLTGIGEKTAAAIIEEREAHGPFASVEDIMRVSGIGEKKLEKIQDQICV